MANEYRKLKQKTSRTRQSRAAARKRLLGQNPQQSGWRSRFLSALALMVLFSSAGLIITCGWISILFILDPKQVVWLNDFLPTGAKINVSKTEIPKTLAEIQNSLKKQNRITGESLSLESTKTKNNQQLNLFLLPIFQRRNNCRSNCQELVELRVYQRSREIEFRLHPEPHYHQVKQLEINGLTKFFVESPLGKNVSNADSQDKEVYLPLTEIKAFDHTKSLPGFWFYLRGEHQKDNQTIAYGQIIHYNPQLRSLEQMLSWKNPNGQLPKWQQIMGSDTEELVIDQTVGLEPRFQLHQIKPGELVSNSLFLEPINLKPVIKGFGYESSLLLARNGLWTPAEAWLTSLQKELGKSFPEYVQAQINLIRLHSQFTKVQANKNWASPSQKVLTNLIDGRWEQGLDVLISSPDSGREIFNLLQADRGMLWNRATVALRLNPDRKAVLAWSYLILTVQRGEKRANDWLEAQPKVNRETFTYLQDLLVKLNDEIKNTHPSQIIGGVQKITTVKYADWLPVDGKAEMVVEDDKVLYQVDVSAFQDGKNWISYPFTNFALPKIQTSLFWIKTLGISSDGNIQIAVWLPNGEQQVNTATIKAVQMRDGELKLLVVGDPIVENQDSSVQHKPLAFTTAALEWLQPSPISLEALAQVNMEAVEAALPKFWNALQESGDISTDQLLSLAEIWEKMREWPVQMIDVTQDGKPDLVLTISNSAIASLTESRNETSNKKLEERPRTMIVSATGEVIYNDFTTSKQTLTAIAKLNSDQSIALLVENGDQYKIRRWSETNQRLE
ncbi:hypothetical protein WJM97_22435 [Okeanomitos corallinicola TIOX110]|uniref:Uncharacterized protein n=1 Tax=Okeanomitos corallinicola TIOX110 TaxID=3133117 RepID=A0ABZ2USZ0_9CYAN